MIDKQAVFNAVRDAIFLADCETGMIVDANPAAETLCGKDIAELRRLHLSQLYTAETAVAAQSGLDDGWPEAGLFQGHVIHKSGLPIPVEISASRFTSPGGKPMRIDVFRETTERDAGREALRRSEERFGQVAETVGEFVWEVDADGLYVYANPVVEQILGYKPEEVVGKKHFYDFLVPETRDEVKRAAFEVFARREPFRTFLNWNVTRDGRRVALETTGLPVWDSHGVFCGYRGADTDVTERRRTEEALRQSEKIYRAVGESIDYGVWICAPDGRNTYASDSFLKLVGLTQEQCSDFGWADALHPDVSERTTAAWKECVRKQGRWDKEHRFRGVDGGWHPVLSRGVPIRDEHGQVTCWAGISLDISELKEAQESLRSSEAQARNQAAELQTIMEAVPAAILIAADPECRHISGNRSAYALLRQRPGSNLSLSAPDGEGPANFRVIRAGVELSSGELPIQWVARTGKPLRDYELQVVFDDGTRVDLLGTAEPLFDGNGRPRGAVAVLSDITKHKRTEEALRQSEHRFRSLFENATVGIYRTTPAGEIEIANPTLVRMLGYESFASLAQRNLEESGFEPEYSRTAFRQNLEEHGKIQGLEATWTRQDGTKVCVRESARCVRDATGAVRYYEGIVEDVTERKRIEDALRQSEQKFAAAFHLGPGAMSIHDIEDGNRILDVNEGFEQTSGFKRAELVGRTALELGFWPVPDEHVEAQSQFMKNGRLRNFEFHFRAKNGEVRTGLVSAEPMEINERKCAITCTIDITERKHAEAALRESEVRLTEAQRLAKIGSFEQDLKTGKIRWSGEMFRIFGLPVGEEPDFAALLTQIHPKDREKITHARIQAVSSGAPVETEFRLVRPGGEVRFLRSITESIQDDRGTEKGFRGATQDITQHVQAMELIAASERRLSNAERIAHVGNWRWDVNANRVFWSEELFRILGTPQNCTPGYELFLQMVAPPDRAKVDQWVKDCLAGAAAETAIEFQVARADGDVRTVMSVIELTRDDDDGSVAHVSGTCQDITDARRTQEESYARQKLESLGTLASGIAHDFNNVLGAILAQAELATAELESGSYPGEELKQIRNMAIRGSEIVRQLMVYAGKETDVLERVDVSKTIEETLGLLKTSVSKHALLVTELAASVPGVYARPAQLRQIVMNLVMNASDAIGGRDGVIRVSTASATFGPETAGALPDGLAEGDYVVLEVSDTGPGIAPAIQAKMFDPFFTTKSAGRGLGLAVVHGIVRSLHGGIRVASELGRGASFRILLPCSGAADGVADGGLTGELQAPSPEPPASILFLEDEDPLRLAVRKMLTKAAFTVLEAANGNEAIELLQARSGEIDLLLLDMTIPGRSTAEVLAEAARLRPDLKAVLTSAYSEEMVMSGISSPLVRGFIRKPFHLATLVQKLRSVLANDTR